MADRVGYVAERLRILGTMTRLLLLAVSALFIGTAQNSGQAAAFTRSSAAASQARQTGRSIRSSIFMSTTTVAPPDTEKKEKEGEFKVPDDGGDTRGPIEWLIDDRMVSREDGEPFHILLLDETFRLNDRITVEYVASSCAYVLMMPYDEAAELAAMSKAQGFSCLGTWPHEEAVRLGKQLQNRDIVCRVVPYAEGGDRPWQARDARDESMKPADAGWN